MKFLFVGSKANLDLNRIGGIESTMRELIIFLKKENHDVKVVLIDPKIKDEKHFKTEFGDVLVETANIPEIRKHLFNNYDVINFLQTPFENPLFALCYLGYKIFNKSFTTKFFFTYPTLKNSNFLQKLKLKLLINHTFVFSKRLENMAKQITKNVTMLYPPVSNNYIKPILQKGNSPKKILFVGRLSHDKGLDIVLKVFEHLPKEKYYLSIIGYYANDGDKNNYEKKISDLKLDFVKVVSPTADKKQVLPLNEYDMLLLPYHDLGPTLDTPLLILEGLSSNCKIITSNIEPLNYIEGNIYFVDDFSNYMAFVKIINQVSDTDNTKNIIDYSTNNFGNLYLKSLRKMGLNV